MMLKLLIVAACASLVVAQYSASCQLDPTTGAPVSYFEFDEDAFVLGGPGTLQAYERLPWSPLTPVDQLAPQQDRLWQQVFSYPEVSPSGFRTNYRFVNAVGANFKVNVTFYQNCPLSWEIDNATACTSVGQEPFEIIGLGDDLGSFTPDAPTRPFTHDFVGAGKDEVEDLIGAKIKHDDRGGDLTHWHWALATSGRGASLETRGRLNPGCMERDAATFYESQGFPVFVKLDIDWIEPVYQVPIYAQSVSFWYPENTTLDALEARMMTPDVIHGQPDWPKKRYLETQGDLSIQFLQFFGSCMQSGTYEVCDCAYALIGQEQPPFCSYSKRSVEQIEKHNTAYEFALPAGASATIARNPLTMFTQDQLENDEYVRNVVRAVRNGY